MKKTSLLLILSFCFSAFIPVLAQQKIQLVILFDTSNSMDGLIDQAKSRIWAIVNNVSDLKYQGTTPSLEIAMYDYGNTGIKKTNWIRKQLDFTTDLDLVSQKLFALRTNGGDEYCGAAIKQSIDELKWSANSSDLKLIYIAGNEPFNQGPVNYKEVCADAQSKGIIISTIYCGDYNQGIKELWKDGSTCSNGEYFNINSDRTISHIKTPYDDEINTKNNELNKTYLWYGSKGATKKVMQEREDNNSMNQSASVAVERTIAKSKSNYNNVNYDLVDAMAADSTVVNKLSKAELPAEMKDKSQEEIEEIILEKSEERSNIQKEISELSLKRQKYIEEERKKSTNADKSDDFGTAVNKSIKEIANSKGFQ